MVDPVSSGFTSSGGMGWDTVEKTNKSSQSQAMDKQTFGAQVVTKTLDYMNQDPMKNTGNADYDFQKSVLTAAYVMPDTLFDYEV